MKRLAHKRVVLWTAAIVFSVALVMLAAAWVYPTSSFLFLPHAAQPLDGRVEVEGSKRVDDRGGIYYVDVTVRRARWIEWLLPFTRPDGATMVPEQALLQPGSSFEERRRVSLAEMARSETVAAAVALRAAGYDVVAQPRGAIVESIDPSAPAVRVLKDGDVIVEAAGERVRTTGDLRRAVGTRRAGRVGRAARPPRRSAAGADRADDAGAGRSETSDHRHPRRTGCGHRAAGQGRHRSRGRRRAFGRVAVRARRPSGARTDIDHGYRVAATGELELDGTVHPIGGMRQKVLGVREAGAEVFVVPAGDNAAVARRYAGNLRVIAVENFQQALRALATLPQK